MRLIDADAIRYTEYKCRDTLADGSYSEFYSEYRVDKRRIDSMPTVNQWIPCSERLPEEDERVLVSDYYGDVEIAYLTAVWNGDEIKKRWLLEEVGFIDVLAWMPLPSVYCGE